MVAGVDRRGCSVLNTPFVGPELVDLGVAKTPRPSTKRTPKFNPVTFLSAPGVARTVTQYEKGDPVFSQGDPCHHVYYVQKGGVKLSVVSETGQEAIIAMLSPGDFFGEGCLAGQTVRMGTATAVTASTIMEVKKESMQRVLHEEHAFSDRFIKHMLARNVRIEEDLIDQLFNSSEKRLARALLLLARYGKQDRPQRVVPKISQESLAAMIGTTRPRVNFFLNKFRKLGFIEYNGELKINSSLLTVVLHD